MEHEERRDPDSPLEKQVDDKVLEPGHDLVSPSQQIKEEDSKLEESPDPQQRRQSAVDMGIVQDFFIGGGVGAEEELE